MYMLILFPLLMLTSLVAIFSLMFEDPDRVVSHHYPYGEIDN